MAICAMVLFLWTKVSSKQRLKSSPFPTRSPAQSIKRVQLVDGAHDGARVKMLEVDSSPGVSDPTEAVSVEMMRSY